MAKSWSNKVWDDIKSQIAENMTSLISSLKEGMTKTTESQKNDW
jgi:hypothetical protein